jgi:hypothetical protein
VERLGRLGVGFGGVDPRVLFKPRAQVTPVRLVPLTGLTGTDSLLSFARVNVWWVPYCLVLQLFHVWSVLGLGRSVWWIWDFLAWTGLTGVLYRPD